MIIQLLIKIIFQIKDFSPPPQPGFFAKIFKGKSKVESPNGLYLWGTVGTGKTMLMDLFYECIPTDKKKRVGIGFFLSVNYH